jgi:hypothetical protein
MDTSIFGLRFKSNESLQPAAADLEAFLASQRSPGSMDTHQDDFADFRRYVEIVEQFESGPYRGLGRPDFGQRMLLEVLSHTRFFRPSLRIAIEEYKYHLHQLLTLDFSKPEKFVRSAEEELLKLNPKKRDDQQKNARLQALIAQRKKDIDALIRQRRMLAGELCHIAAYVRDNIVRVQLLCEGAMASLVDLQIGGEKTAELIEDLKAHFKEEVRGRRQMGAVTPEYLETVKAEVAQLSQRLTQMVLEDMRTVTGIYEGFSRYAKQNAARLTELIDGADRARKNDAARDNQVFSQIEQALVALIQEFRAEVKPPASERTEERHEDLLREKRREMLDHIFSVLKEQRKAETRTI